MNHSSTMNFNWIKHPGLVLVGTSKVSPAPMFRRVIPLTSTQNTTLKICGLGYFELYVNGRKVSDNVLDPVVTQYDKRVRFVEHQLDSYLHEGENVIGVILGNGWYNESAKNAWNFQAAAWRDYPKLTLELEQDQKTLLVSDNTWKVTQGPIVFDQLRNGETYDARLEKEGWLDPDYNDDNWPCAVQAHPPGGDLEQQTMPSCQVMRSIPAKSIETLADGDLRIDFGQNIAGWVKICTQGTAGQEVTICYDENIEDYKNDLSPISAHVQEGDFQTDRYIRKGSEEETWAPRFTYHGFRYVHISSDAKLIRIEAQVVHTAFDKIGALKLGDPQLEKLIELTDWSYIGNFVGIPTDCPHREKNGWTGDAHLACEVGLYNYDSADSYNQWIDTLCDTQRSSGQLPGIAPSAGWGYNWGSGPAWDAALFIIPWNAYLFTGDDSALKRFYPHMKKYIQYLRNMADHNIVSIGLGDWCHPEQDEIVEVPLTSTAYFYACCDILCKVAGVVHQEQDAKEYTELCVDIKKSYLSQFYHGDGTYAKGEICASAISLYYGLFPEHDEQLIARKLSEAVREKQHTAFFGILGAKYTPRVLATHGYIEDAYQIFTQPKIPGWISWIDQGATTLWENWNGKQSQNHIMFGDIYAWLYKYAAGISPCESNPGFKHILIEPHFIPQLGHIYASHKSPHGEIVCAWKIQEDRCELDIEIPNTCTASLTLPNTEPTELKSGKHHFDLKL